ncbi:MAG: PAS domain-containing sensor histidine kinase [Cyanobacteriota bacterium]|nr:PAS domain-containing sensor histidine kinase [Cyanobacteriota bacterium]
MELMVGILLGLGVGLLLGGGILWRWRQTSRQLLSHLGSELNLKLALLPLSRVHFPILKRHREQQAQIQVLGEQIQDWERLATWMPLGFLLVDENNWVIHCNPVAQKLLHIQHWQPRIKLLLEWVRSYELDQLVEEARQVQTDNRQQPQTHEWLFYPTGGESKPIPIRGWAISLSQNQIGIFLEDRIEAKTLVQQRDRWASDVAHELKTPLTSIRLVAETLQPRVDPALRHWVDRLLNETIRLGSLVQDLLELSSLNLATTAALRISYLDMVPLLQEAWQSLEPQARPRGQWMDYQGPDSVMLWGDPQRLYRLFLNLLDNSIKYGKGESAVHVQIHPGEGWIKVEVFDHGIGLPSNAFQTVFEPFYRTDTARARSEGGTGLGLAIVRQIVEAHGGTITAQNHPEVGGLWIQFRLNAKLLEANYP